MAPPSQFDKEVEERRLANERKLKELGLGAAVQKVKDAAAAEAAAARPPPRPRQPRSGADAKPREPVEPRRSTRERAQVTYNEDAAFRQLIPSAGRQGGGGRQLKLEDLTPEEAEALRILQESARNARASKAADKDKGGKAPRGPRDSGKGLRCQGGQWYDSTAGVTCHWCRQKTITLKITCKNPGCGGGRAMPTSFCERCLRNRHGEDANDPDLVANWKCPCCRGSCGKGCITCCNCGPCRKKANLLPTHQIMEFARAKGYSNAHDYLVGSITGETQEQLTQRKMKNLWIWRVDAPPPEEGDEDLPPLSSGHQVEPDEGRQQQHHKQEEANGWQQQKRKRPQEVDDAADDEESQDQNQQQEEEEQVQEEQQAHGGKRRPTERAGPASKQPQLRHKAAHGAVGGERVAAESFGQLLTERGGRLKREGDSAAAALNSRNSMRSKSAADGKAAAGMTAKGTNKARP